MLRPMRPKPLMPTLIGIGRAPSECSAAEERVGLNVNERRPGSRATPGNLVRSSRQAEGDSRRDGHDLPVIAFDQLPSALMHHAMVPATEQDQVVELGGSTVDPVHQVMAVAL